jgi:hypothetical protein
MSRNGSGVYSLPAGSTVTNGDTSDASDLNTPLADLEADANIPRPIVAGGTGASSASAALVNLGLTATAAEINVLDGITASTAELNILDGVTATATELNYVGGVTSAIQTQLNAKQASDATLTSLSGLSLAEGDVLYATAADTLARLPKGTAAQSLVMNAGATAPEWASGSRVLLASKTASASATLDFTEFNNAVYRYYEFELENVKPATNGVVLFVRFSSNGGSSYDSGASDYQWTLSGNSNAGFSDQSSAATAAAVAPLMGNAATERGVSGRMTLYHAGDAATYTRFLADVVGDNTANHVYRAISAGRRLADQDTDAVRFLLTSGNIASGTIRMYGLT